MGNALPGTVLYNQGYSIKYRSVKTNKHKIGFTSHDLVLPTTKEIHLGMVMG